MAHVHDKYDFTVSFFLIHPSKSKIALHFHKKLNLWNNFGGHIELDEDPLECLHKEMLEETGFAPNDYEIIETHDSPKGVGVKELPNPFGMNLWKYADQNHWHIDLPFILKCKKDSFSPQAGESIEIEWFSLEKIRKYNSQNKIDEGVLKICEWIFKNYV